MAVASCDKFLRYKDKVLIVTGGSKGIGEGCVRVFVRNGAYVAFCARGAADGERLEKEMNEEAPGKAFFKSVDLTDEAAIQGFVEDVISRYGRIDCLINNAGQHPNPHLIDDITAEKFRQVLDVNLLSYFLMSKYCLPHLRKVKGNIINDSSLVGKIGQQAAIPYVASKGAIDAMTRAMAIDEAVHGVRVNVFSPGNVWTPMWDGLATDEGEGREDMIAGGTNAQAEWEPSRKLDYYVYGWLQMQPSVLALTSI
ncbi:17-beta-hydroxysteroid dehydrogenase 14-like isoform X2 [Watersipora subatra]|uniref:17-beta-hydroxysteroid dehydrogenase 14-like isoform X2 n=1 Tax=Watersipora subatra TaxID=2589382 RepID=UPI00355B6098